MADFVPSQLNGKAELYRQRNALYGDTYKLQGEVMAVLFKKDQRLRTVSDHNRFAIFQTMISKVCRYASNFDDGGHEDSLDDISVYSMMLKELDVEKAESINQYKSKPENNNGL